MIARLTAVDLVRLVGRAVHFAIASHADVDAGAKVALPLILGTDWVASH